MEHNREAYEASVKLLSELGKAAIIHPTGTGKSLIAFQLCPDHPESRICRLVFHRRRAATRPANTPDGNWHDLGE